jgi:phosphoribosylformimino-5-aminoimidazole carboxamide ribotide isomerase
MSKITKPSGPGETHEITIFPAVDLKGGRCVRLRQGKMDEVSVYGDDPVAAARHWIEQGATWLHVVDLDGAVEGAPINQPAIGTILESVKAKIQVGGGIRTLEQVEWYLEHGAARVVVGTSAINQPGFVRDAAARFPGRIVVSLDAKAGELYVDGWTRSTGRGVGEVAHTLAASGVTQLILTDIQRDGMLGGLNRSALRDLVEGLPLPAIIAGGVTTLDDLIALKSFPRVNGAIIGKALYTKSIDLKAALQCARERGNGRVIRS